jgi:hypothetical protein
MSEVLQIYVSLLGENVEVWRPVTAERLRDNVYRILDQTYDRDIESWQFEPGDDVVCELVNAEPGPILAAQRKAESAVQIQRTPKETLRP